MQLPHRSGLLCGVALVTCATTLLEVTMVRLYTALHGHPLAFAFMALSLLFLGVGGVLVYVFPSLAPQPAFFARLANMASAASFLTIVALIVLAHISPQNDFAPPAILRLAALLVSSSIPFVLIGMLLATTVRHASVDIGYLYLVDVAGIALAGFLTIVLLRAGAPRAGLILAIAFAVSSIFFYLASRATDGAYGSDQRPGGGGAVATFVLGSSVLLAGDIGAPWMKPPLDRAEFQAWSEHGWIAVQRPRSGISQVDIDDLSIAPLVSETHTPPPEPSQMAYVLHNDQGPVLVLGAGGGRDIRVALIANQKNIHATETNAVMVNQVMRDRYNSFYGALFDKPEVHLSMVHPRIYVARSAVPFRNIVVPLMGERKASTTGIIEFSPDYLYTLDAFHSFLSHLSPEGTLTVTRWDEDFERLVALSTAALEGVGINVPQKHLFACSTAHATSLLIKRTQMSRADMDALRRFCRKHKFVEVLSYDKSGRRQSNRRTKEPEPVAEAPVDLRPPTDDRPFFNDNVPKGHLLGILGSFSVLKTQHQGLLMISFALLVALGFAAIFLLAPLLVQRSLLLKAHDRLPRLRLLAFFGCLGMGFVLIEMSLVHKLDMFVGQPTYAKPSLLAAMLLSSGVGGLVSARVDVAKVTRSASMRAAILAAIIAVIAVALQPLFSVTLAYPTVLRIVVAVGLLIPLGFLTGCQISFGVRLLALRSPNLLTWCWGLMGISAAIALCLGTLLAMRLGYGAAILVGAISYLAAAILVPRPTLGDSAANKALQAWSHAISP